MSDFNYVPAPGTRLKKAPRKREARFGDGYIQRVVDGINNDPQVWEVIFNVTEAVADEIESLLDGYGSTDAFTWTPPGNKDEITVLCSGHERSYPNNRNTSSITCTFEQVFDIGTALATLTPGTIVAVSHTDSTANLAVDVMAFGGRLPRSRQWRHDIGAGMVDIVGENSTTLVDTGVPDDTDIDYELTTTDADGNEVTTPIVTVHTDVGADAPLAISATDSVVVASFGALSLAPRVIISRNDSVTVVSAVTVSIVAGADTPLVIFGGTDLQAWYDKDVPGTAGSWTDRSGNGNHLLQATSGNQPTIAGNGTRDGDGVDDFMLATFTLNQVCTIFGRIKLNVWATPRSLWDGAIHDFSSLQTTTSSPQVATFAGGGFLSTTRNATVGAYVSVIAQYGSGTASYLNIDGSEVTGVDIGALNPGGLCLFGSPGAVTCTDMTAAAFGAVNRAITGGEKTSLLAYLTALI